MKTIQEIAQEIEAKRNELNIDKRTSSDKREFFNGLADLLTNVADYLAEELKHDNKVEITNFPKPITEVKVNNFRGIFGLLETISKTVKKFKLPDVFKVSGEVMVKNQVTIPKIDIPEYPKSMSVDNLIDYTKKLSEISDKISKLKFDPKIEVKNQAPQVSIDLEGVKTLLESLTEEIKRIQVTPEVNIDLESLEKAANKTTKAVESIRFPVPNFSSSWQKSLTMQSEDLGKHYEYTTVGGTKAISYIEFTGIDGKKYRKTFTYSSNDANYPDDETSWTEV